MQEEPPFIGKWYFERKLGSGGFGVVALWKNQETQQLVAIKKGHILTGQNVSTEKQRERWNREIELMTYTIQNKNIVRACKVKPESFLTELQKYNKSGMPLLVMEYCDGGDLRQMLNENRNTSGLPDNEVRNVLRSLRSAIAYLHDLKITHRDIKPENIVIKYEDGNKEQKIYKLTDLGYAKPLDRKSIEASLVGTMEYLAPELLFTEKYSNSVDYWSFGIISFEVITGVRPFIPHMALAQWVLRVKEKKSETICIEEDNAGNVICSSELYPENYITNSLKKLLEPWLKLGLEWDPKQRGHIFETVNGKPKSKAVSFIDPNGKSVNGTDPIAPTHKLKIFSMLDEILDKKILTMFCLYTYRFLSFEISVETTMQELLTYIEKLTGIEAEKIYITVSINNDSIQSIKPDTKPIDLYFIDNRNTLPMIYISRIYDKPTKSMNDDFKMTNFILEIPKSVAEICNKPNQSLKLHAAKKFANNAYYFIRGEQKKYVTCLNGFYNYALQLNHDIEIHREEINRMIRLVYGLNGSIESFGHMIENTKSVLCVFCSLDCTPLRRSNSNNICPGGYVCMQVCDDVLGNFGSLDWSDKRIRYDILTFWMNIFIVNEKLISGKSDLPDLSTIWPSQCEELLLFNKTKQNAMKMMGACEKILHRYESASRRSRESYEKKFITDIDRDYFDLMHLDKEFESVRFKLLAKDFHTADKSQFVRPMFQCVIKCLKKRDELLRHHDFSDWQNKAYKVCVEMEEIKKALEMAIAEVEKYKSDLFKAIAKLFDDIWHVIGQTNFNRETVKSVWSNGEQKNSHNEYLPDLELILNNASNEQPVNDCIAGDVKRELKQIYGSKVECFGESDDINSLIEDNDKLLLSMEDLMNDISEEFHSIAKQEQ